MDLTKQDIRRIRIRNSGLVTPFNSIEACVAALFGVQSQAQQFGEISVLNRVDKVSVDDFKRLYESYELIKLWGQRMTVHMYTRSDWKIIHQVYAHRNNFVKRGWMDKQPGLEEMLVEIDTFMQGKKISKKELSDLIETKVPHIQEQYRDYSLFLQAGLEGIFFAIPQMPQTEYFVHRSVCIKEDDYQMWKIDYEKSLEFLLMNYFRYYGPATLSDFCHWSGLTKREAEKAFVSVRNELSEIPCEGKSYYLPLDAVDLFSYVPDDANDSVKLLGKFDPLFLSFSDKTWIANAKQQKEIWRIAAHVEAVLLANNELFGTWRYAIKGNKIEFTIYSFKNIPVKIKKKVAYEADKIAGYLSKQLHKINYE